MAEPDRQQTHEPGDVRQGEIILKKRWQRIVFIAGLVAAVLFALYLVFATYG
jgi:hypothetical protein